MKFSLMESSERNKNDYKTFDANFVTKVLYEEKNTKRKDAIVLFTLNKHDFKLRLMFMWLQCKTIVNSS
jgi:hypothetical protein